MNRRKFFSSSSAAALAAASSPVASSAAAPPVLLKLGCQSAPTSEKHLAFLARYGVRHICGYPPIAEPGRLYD